MPTIHKHLSSGEIERAEFINLLETALKTGEHRFARRAALQWLSQFSGDLEVNLLQIKAFYAGGGRPATVLGHIHQLVKKDPYFSAAYQFGVEVWEKSGEAAGKTFLNGLYATGGRKLDELAAPWARGLRQVGDFLHAGALEEAETALLPVIADDPPTPLVAATHIELMRLKSEHQQAHDELITLKLLQHYAHRWDTCLPIRLALAEALLSGADPDQGVIYLHSAMAEDVAGQVVTRMYGTSHPLTEMWPRRITGRLDLPVPASIAFILGWNRIEDSHHQPSEVRQKIWENFSSPVTHDRQSPAAKTPENTDESLSGFLDNNLRAITTEQSAESDRQRKTGWMPETLISTQSTLEEVARKIHRPELMQSEGRFPVYVIVSNKKALQRKYGPQGSARVIQSMRQLQWVIKQRGGWNSIVLLVDDPQTTAAVAVKPVFGEDAWAVKNLLRDVDKQLSARGQMIGALLIVGGPEIVPFHHLPNPVDDLDIDVPSDNPYAALDENFFVPDWPVGRLPGDASNNPDNLIRLVNLAVNYHASREIKQGWIKRLARKIQNWLRKSHLQDSNYGYTAAVWSRASAAVFQPLGHSKNLLVSPPASYQEFKRSEISGILAYFNLHGIQDSPDWYGHNDPSQPASGPDYPVALRPVDINRSNRIPAVIFSEACFGGDIQGKLEDESIALRFLSHGAACMIGSTSTAYGAVTTPLIAADYLANRFWKHLKQGIPVGEALKRAKIDLIQEMDQRQGYLDGEDQKTLISFVLYGDPLFQYDQNRAAAKDVIRSLDKPTVYPIREMEPTELEQSLTSETVYTVKQLVREYLPGLENGTLKVHSLRPNGEFDRDPGPGLFSKHPRPKAAPANRSVVTVSKTVQRRRKLHHQFARVTLDQYGQLIKISVSR